MDIERKADDLLSKFKESGIPERSLLLICLRNGFEWMASLVTCLKGGIVAVFADFGTKNEDLATIANASRAWGSWDGVTLERESRHRTRRFRDANIVLGKLTSGSTGLPKCIFFKDSEMLADGFQMVQAFELTEKDINFGIIPWGHAYGLGAIVMPFLILGFRIAWNSSPLPADIEHCIATRKPTVFPSVPTILRALSLSECDPKSFASIRLIITAGARLEPKYARIFVDRYGIAPRNLYGSSETGSVCYDATGEITLEGSSVGSAIPGVSIVQKRDRRLKVTSSAVYTYENRLKTSDGMGQCLMGDFGSIDSQGLVTIETRAKGFVKVGEKRVGLVEVETRLESLPVVRAAHVFSIATDNRVAIAAAIETDVSRKEIAKAIRSWIPRKYRPAIWISLGELPTTSRGKRDSKRIEKLVFNKSRLDC